MVSWQTTTASLLARLTVKQQLQRDVSVERLREQIGAIERLFPEHPPGFVVAHDHPLPRCDAEWLREKGSATDRVILHFPGGAYVARLPNMERAMMARICARSQRARTPGLLPAGARTPVPGGPR